MFLPNAQAYARPRLPSSDPVTAPRLHAHELACQRGDRLLFRALSFALEGGDILHVTGANGTGKTTLMRALAGLTTPFAGTVACEGARGLLDERTALDPDLPLGRALAFWRRLDAGGDGGEVRARLALDALLDVPVRYLSTGQRKRAGIAVLLARGVPIWLLDEPLSGLDHAAIALVQEIIAGHARGGGIAVIASHQPLGLDSVVTLALEDHRPQVDAV
jgi:heme exporter protein A